ncbi:hypothetical protein [Cupriavidus oxalaticus]|uniref:Uncharacterized protein n=1 Tax=Cupriavidus oxalaticus TaxID=96344 RepID=A0A4P7LQU2_9BURK|nr:hypothetical protein [Cupriavidus oxalaticus]QBY56023.1 hypothetical protein E0W60_33755 [Cupriavidus oxalaticus]
MPVMKPTLTIYRTYYAFNIERLALPVLRVVQFERRMRRDAQGNDCIVSDAGVRFRARIEDLHANRATAEALVLAARASIRG